MSKTTTKFQILELAGKKNLISAADLVSKGLPRENLSRYAKQGLLKRVNRGLYSLPDRNYSEYQSLIEVCKQMPKGVICLLSALRFHELTTQNPFEVWLAVESKSWVPKINYPPVRFVYFSSVALSAGVEVHQLDGVRVSVFSPAKTIVDCFKYRNKIGLDVALEALRDAWRQKRFTMDELFGYAKICRVQNVIRPYIEILV